MILLKDGQQYTECRFRLEADFEKIIVEMHKLIFGKNTVYIDAKKKIGSNTLGSAIPDGFLFDMSDPDNQEFYLVEVELESHDFYRHIFPQITKFFAFYKNSTRQKELVEKLFSTINTDKELKRQFKKYLGEQEIYKFLSDVIDNSQNILLVIDGEKPELPEITDTYSDTWGKMVKVLTVKQYVCKDDAIVTIHPEFETIEFSYEETPAEVEKKSNMYSEEFHVEGIHEHVKELYAYIKTQVTALNNAFIFNPQKYYISIKGAKNIVFMKLRKKKIRMIVMLPEDEIRARISNHPIKSLSAPVQKFYSAPCAAVDIHDLEHIDEIIEVIKVLMDANSPIGTSEEGEQNTITPSN